MAAPGSSAVGSWPCSSRRSAALARSRPTTAWRPFRRRAVGFHERDRLRRRHLHVCAVPVRPAGELRRPAPTISSARSPASSWRFPPAASAKSGAGSARSWSTRSPARAAASRSRENPSIVSSKKCSAKRSSSRNWSQARCPPRCNNRSSPRLILAVLGVVLSFFAAACSLQPQLPRGSPNTVAILSVRKRGCRMAASSATRWCAAARRCGFRSSRRWSAPPRRDDDPARDPAAYTLKGVPVRSRRSPTSDPRRRHVAAGLGRAVSRHDPRSGGRRSSSRHSRGFPMNLGTLTDRGGQQHRQSFAQKLTSEAAQDLEKMGIGWRDLTMQEISDERVTSTRSAAGAPPRSSATRPWRDRGPPRPKIKSAAAMEGEKTKFEADADMRGARPRDFMIRQARFPGRGIETPESPRPAGRAASEATARQAVVGGEVTVDQIRTRDDRRPGAGSPAPPEGARGHGHQAGRCRRLTDGGPAEGAEQSAFLRPKAAGRR